MPSLKDLVQRVHDNLDYNPDLQQYKDAVVRRVNDHYLEISSSAPWLFLQNHDAQIAAKATVTGSSTATIAISTGAGNRRLVTGTGTSFANYMDGQRFIGPDGVNMVIGHVVNTTTLYLTTPYAGGAVSVPIGNGEDWSIEFPRYAMPSDCLEVLGWMDRDGNYGRLVFVDACLEEYANLKVTDTGTPWVAVENRHVVDRPPAIAPSLAASLLVGNLVTAHEYEYMYTLAYEGRESPPSPAASITLTGGATGVEISGMENSTWTDGAFVGLDTQRLKNLYRRDVTDNGPWQLVGKQIAAGTTTYTDLLLVPAYATDVEGIDEFLEAEPRQYVRLWETAGADVPVDIRYHYRPPRLVADAHVPLWPVAFHYLIVYRVMQDIWMQHGNESQAQIWERKAAALLSRMRQKYLSRDDRKYKKQMFSRFPRWHRDNYGPPSIS